MNSNDIKVIIGLGNPGNKHYYQRHSIGFRILDLLAAEYGAPWKERPLMEIAEITIHEKKIMLIKPQTYMNNSGKVVPFLLKQGIKPENILVVHDELELPFGQLKVKVGGSSKGHNGLRSLINAMGDNFMRLRVGIGRPERKEEVPDYVLTPFDEPETDLVRVIEQAVTNLFTYIK